MTPEELAVINPDMDLYIGLDEAIIGYAERINFGPVAAYSVNKIIEILMRDNDWNEEEAVEFYDFNIEATYTGEYSPIFVKTNNL